MEFVCDICEQPVHVFAGASETRCQDCQAALPDTEDDEAAALRRLLQDEHEKGRGSASLWAED